jgi:hypothetical protein
VRARSDFNRQSQAWTHRVFWGCAQVNPFWIEHVHVLITTVKFDIAAFRSVIFISLAIRMTPVTCTSRLVLFNRMLTFLECRLILGWILYNIRAAAKDIH